MVSFYEYIVANNRQGVISYLKEKGYPCRNQNIPASKLAVILKDVTKRNGEDFLKEVAKELHPDADLFEAIYQEKINELKAEGDNKPVIAAEPKPAAAPIVTYAKSHIPEIVIGGALILILGKLILSK